MSQQGLRTLLRGKVVTVEHETATLPDGRSFEFEVVRHPGGAAAVAMDEVGRVCLLHQYRHVVGGWLWELPAGKLDGGEAPLTAAQRELAEEAGVAAADWVSLGSMLSSPGVFTERVHLFLARGITATEAHTEEHELFDVHWVDFDQALGWAASGEIVDAKTVIGLWRAGGKTGRAPSPGPG